MLALSRRIEWLAAVYTICPVHQVCVIENARSTRNCRSPSDLLETAEHGHSFTVPQPLFAAAPRSIGRHRFWEEAVDFAIGVTFSVPLR